MSDGTPLDLETARKLVDMGDHPRAPSQLRGAVAIHNILQRERVAYLADEVGLGKTYVALAVIGLMRHFNPDLRVLVIAPRKNIQHKWRDDHLDFVRSNWTVHDLRVKGASGGPARLVEVPDRLADLAHESMVDDDRDFIARLTSFSHALTGKRDEVENHRELVRRVQRQLPWIPKSTFPQGMDGMRDFLAQGYNSALPKFDLVVIDEAHNLSGGVSIAGGKVGTGPLRNTILAQVLGHPEVTPHRVFADTYRPLAEHVLLLSATPVESSFSALWRQIHLVGKHQPPGRPDFAALKSSDEAATECARRVLVRRINALEVNGERLTKNLYRRTWHAGGVGEYDVALPAGSARERLTVALVQKKVADQIGAKCDNNFQMGMLASFESYGRTEMANAKEKEAVFDGDQAETDAERLGIDVDVVNKLVRSHVDEFATEMKHPKMDALVDDLSNSWEQGTKALVFVRRVASVPELKRKLDERYDEWLFARLEAGLPAQVWKQIVELKKIYRLDRIARGRYEVDGGQGAEDERGSSDTFFGWFFRGKGPEELLKQPSFTIESGASVANALREASGSAATFFAHHRVSAVLGVEPAASLEQVEAATGLTRDVVLAEIQRRAASYLPASAGRRHRFDAVQTATLELLTEHDHDGARQMLHAVAHGQESLPGRVNLDVASELSVETFFTRVHAHPDLANEFRVASPDPFDQELADAVVRAAARNGHALVDLYISFMQATGAARLPANTTAVAAAAMVIFIERLSEQRAGEDRSGAYRELSQLVANFALVRSKNLNETMREGFTLSEAPTLLGTILGNQQPTAGMFGRVNATAVRQFRMPGYPHVLICTDVLQEGADLHLFCDRAVHYGVAWTPSSMEQRTGRIDRLYSLTERRLTALDRSDQAVQGRDLIQVQVPYVPDTIEVLQSRRVFERMHRFTTLMHEGVEAASKRIDISAEMVKPLWSPPVTSSELVSAFDERENDLRGPKRSLAVDGDAMERWWSRLLALASHPLTHELFQEREIDRRHRVVYAWRSLGQRLQPFTLRLASRGPLPLIQASTPIGRVGADHMDDARPHTHEMLSRIVSTFDSDDREYDLAVEGDAILAHPEHDAARVRALVDRVTRDADTVERLVTSGDLGLAQVRATMGRDVRGH